MARSVNEVTIPRSIETCFHYISDFRHAGCWDPRVSQASLQNPEHAVGRDSQFVLDSPLPLLGQLKLPYKIVVFEPPHQVVFRGQCKLGHYEDHLTFTAVSASETNLRYDAFFELQGLFKLLSPLFGLAFKHIAQDATQPMANAVVRANPNY